MMPDAAVQRMGVALGTAFGPVQTSVDYNAGVLAKGRPWRRAAFRGVSGNAPGSHISIEFDLRRLQRHADQRESSLLAAAMFASLQIVKGTVPSRDHRRRGRGQRDGSRFSTPRCGLHMPRMG